MYPISLVYADAGFAAVTNMLDIGYMGLDDDIADKIEWEPTIQWG